MKNLIYLAVLTMLAVSCSESRAQKVLVLYYSQTATTEKVAQEIAGRLGADIEQIALVDPYDGTYQETIERSGRERSSGTLPELKPLAADLSSYDVIFLGYPIWFGTYALPVGSLLKTVDFSGKTIVPFCTFGSGGLDVSVRDLKANLPDAKVLDGYGVRSARIDAMPGEVDRFLKENGFLEGDYVKYDAFGASHPASEAEAAIFDAAVSTYPMISAKAESVSSRKVTGGTEYLFEARDVPRGPAPGPGGPSGTIKVYVLDLDGQDPVFTQVLR